MKLIKNNLLFKYRDSYIYIKISLVNFERKNHKLMLFENEFFVKKS